MVGHLLVITIIRVSDQHSSDAFERTTPMDNLTESAPWGSRWTLRDRISQQKDLSMKVDYDKLI